MPAFLPSFLFSGIMPFKAQRRPRGPLWAPRVCYRVCRQWIDLALCATSVNRWTSSNDSHRHGKTASARCGHTHRGDGGCPSDLPLSPSASLGDGGACSCSVEHSLCGIFASLARSAPFLDGSQSRKLPKARSLARGSHCCVTNVDRSARVILPLEWENEPLAARSSHPRSWDDADVRQEVAPHVLGKFQRGHRSRGCRSVGCRLGSLCVELD